MACLGVTEIILQERRRRRHHHRHHKPSARTGRTRVGVGAGASGETLFGSGCFNAYLPPDVYAIADHDQT